MEYREDIWKRETRENVNFTRELSELNDIKILVKNAVNLYDELGEEVKNEIQNEEKKLEEENKQKMEEERINIRGRRRRNEGIIF